MKAKKSIPQYTAELSERIARNTICMIVKHCLIRRLVFQILLGRCHNTGQQLGNAHCNL